MSIELDWDVSDAPADNEVTPHKSLVNQPKNEPIQGADEQDSGHQPRRLVARVSQRWRWLAGAALLATLVGTGLWYFTQAGWQRVTGDIAAAVIYEDKEAAQGASSLLLNVQDHGNADWLGVRQDEALARQPAPLPMPMLNFGQTPPMVMGLTPLDTDFMQAKVSRKFTTADGQTLTFTLPQFYRRDAANNWLRSAPPGTFWGNWLDWQGAQLVIRYSERDAALVSQLAPLLDERLHAACAAWGDACHTQRPVRLYLSGFVGSLEYNPIANTEVRIELGTPGGSAITPAEYFLSVPSPQIAGLPADEAARSFLADYLTVRLVAALAHHVSNSTHEYYQRTAQAIQTLGLSRADPGYLVSGQGPRGSLPGADGQRSAQGSDFPTRGPDRQTWRVVHYTTVPGDTLPSIAARFKTSVNAIERANRLGNPDFLAAGAKLTIPLLAPVIAPASTPSP